MLIGNKFQVLFNTFVIDSISPFFHNTNYTIGSLGIKEKGGGSPTLQKR